MKHNMFFRRAAVACFAIVLCNAFVALADWPQFQGPNRDGSSPEKGLARAWPKDGPKVLWKLSLAPGYGAPAIRDGEVYLLDRNAKGQDVLLCLDLASGKELWNFAYDAPGSVSHDGPRAVPTVDEKYVYSVGMMGHFICLDRKSHQPVWRKNLSEDFKVQVPMWGVVQAPVLNKNLVIVAPQAKDAYVVAYKRDSGELVWKSQSLGLVGYSIPTIAKIGGVEQVVMIGACKKGGGAPGKVGGISLTDGSILWTYDGFQCNIPIPYPTALSDDRLFITGGYKAGSAMIQVKSEGGKFTVKELFKTDACGSQIHQPLFYNGFLYVNSNSNEREDGMMCLSLDGQIKWKTGDAPSSTTFERGNLILVDGLILNLDGKKGELHLIEPSPDKYNDLASFKVFDGKEIWAPMAFTDGKLLLRNQQELKCLDLKNP